MGFRSFIFSYFLKFGCLFFLQGIFLVYIIGGKDILISENMTNKFNFAEGKITGLFLPVMVSKETKNHLHWRTDKNAG